MPIFKSSEGLEFDSREEWFFYLWLKEAQGHGYVGDWSYHSETWELAPPAVYTQLKQLKTKTKRVQKSLLRSHSYTPDFIFNGTPKLKRLGINLHAAESPLILLPSPSFVVDIKGSWGGIFKSGREFAINQKWVYSKYGIYVNKIVPTVFFKRSWLPERLRFTLKTNKPTTSKLWDGCKTFVEQPDLSKEEA